MSNKKKLFLAFLILVVSLLIVEEVVFLLNTKKKIVQTKNQENTTKTIANKSSILPDIKRSQSINASTVRNDELAKIVSKLPYKDENNNIEITYYPSSKTLVAGITEAGSITDFREKKKLVEAKLKELGADNLCYLVVFWAVPDNIKSQLTENDLTISACLQVSP